MFKQMKIDFRIWRVINTAVLLYGLFSPWLKSCNTETTGFGFVKATPGVLQAILQKASDFLKQDVLSLAPILLADAILIYIIDNVLYVIFSVPNKNWHKISLAVAVCMALLTLVATTRSTNNGRELLWGFWLTCAGLLSSSLLEISESLNPNSGSPPQAQK